MLNKWQECATAESMSRHRSNVRSEKLEIVGPVKVQVARGTVPWRLLALEVGTCGSTDGADEGGVERRPDVGGIVAVEAEAQEAALHCDDVSGSHDAVEAREHVLGLEAEAGEEETGPLPEKRTGQQTTGQFGFQQRAGSRGLVERNGSQDGEKPGRAPREAVTERR